MEIDVREEEREENLIRLRNNLERFLSNPEAKTNPALIADGWERRFMADAIRAEEAIELYHRLGYDVIAEPVTAEELGDECEDCHLIALLRFKTIYTRKKAGECLQNLDCREATGKEGINVNEH